MVLLARWTMSSQRQSAFQGHCSQWVATKATAPEGSHSRGGSLGSLGSLASQLGFLASRAATRQPATRQPATRQLGPALAA